MTVLFQILDVVINWWKFVFVFIALFACSRIYFKATVKQLIFYLPLIEFLVLSTGGLFIDTIDLFSEEQNIYLEQVGTW